jgi:hypothetical protein
LNWFPSGSQFVGWQIIFDNVLTKEMPGKAIVRHKQQYPLSCHRKIFRCQNPRCPGEP